MTKTVFEGIFRLTSPLHCADEATPEGAGKVMRTMKAPIFTPAGMDTVPYFPGNDLRGRLRRKAGAILLDAITSSGAKYDRGVYSGVNNGMNGAQPDPTPATAEEVVRARNHIFMGLFGGGARMLQSGFDVADLMPIMDTTISAGMIPARFAPQPGTDFVSSEPGDIAYTAHKKGERLYGWQLLRRYNGTRIDDLHRVTDVDRVEKQLENGLDEVAAYQLQVLENKRLRKEDKEADAADKTNVKKSDAGNMITFEAIAAGVPMYFKLVIAPNMSDAQIGLMAQAVCDLVNGQKLGGWSRTGLGSFDAMLQMRRNGVVSPLLLKDDTDENYVLSPDMAPFIEAMREEIFKTTVAEVSSFYTHRAPAEDTGTKKTKKAA